jgi:hypothetical protein
MPETIEEIEYIPTWSNTLDLLLGDWAHAKCAKVRNAVQEELNRMAVLADAHVASAKQKKISG